MKALGFDGHRLAGRVFTETHYPRSPQLFYSGLELFMLRDRVQLTSWRN